MARQFLNLYPLSQFVSIMPNGLAVENFLFIRKLDFGDLQFAFQCYTISISILKTISFCLKFSYTYLMANFHQLNVTEFTVFILITLTDDLEVGKLEHTFFR